MTPGGSVTEALVVLDVISTFDHEDGDRLLESMKDSVPALVRALAHARGRIAVVYVNDAGGAWDGDMPGHVARALAARGGEVLQAVMPQTGDRILFKPDYSASTGRRSHTCSTALGRRASCSQAPPPRCALLRRASQPARAVVK